jgi:hypothetical protein
MIVTVTPEANRCGFDRLVVWSQSQAPVPSGLRHRVCREGGAPPPPRGRRGRPPGGGGGGGPPPLQRLGFPLSAISSNFNPPFESGFSACR